MRSSFVRRTDEPILHHSGIQECPNELEHLFVIHPLGNASQQHVVVDPVKELFQVNIDGVAVAFGDVRLGLGHCLMSTAPRAEAIALPGERLIPTLLKDCLLEEEMIIPRDNKH